MQRLIDLDPRWRHEDGRRVAFIFKCPCCHSVWLTCLLERMPMRKQMEMFRPEGETSGGQVVPCSQTFAWQVEGEFDNLTVTPSIDASASGHWHGFIRNGVIQ